MTPWYTDDAVQVWHGDCLDVLADMADNSVDAVVTDPPYGLEFMGREWDRFKTDRRGVSRTTGIPAVPGVRGEWSSGRPQAYDAGLPYQQWCQTWAEQCLRVLKPGGHLLAFGGTRTHHRLTCAIEDAGFEIRDSIAWLYGSGFPKSLDVGKAIDRRRDDGAARRAVGAWLRAQREAAGHTAKQIASHWPSASGGITGCVANWELGFNLPTWEQWQRLRELIGFGDDMDAEVWRLNGRKGTPGEAWEQREVIGESVRGPAGFSAEMVPRPWKAAIGETYDLTAPATDDARRWNGWGTALKPAHEPVVVARKPLAGTVAANVLAWGTGGLNIDAARIPGMPPQVTQGLSSAPSSWEPRTERQLSSPHDAGRWPPNVALDQATADQLDRESGVSRDGTAVQRNGGGQRIFNQGDGLTRVDAGYGGEGGASRFFPVFRYEPTCALYGMLSECERTPSASLTTPANTAKRPSATSPVTTAASALEDAPTRSAEPNALAALSAGMLCASCVTAIARSVAAISHGHSATQALGLPSTADSSERILTRSLALIAEDLAKPATTSTITDLTTSLGCAVDAISTYITRAFRHERRRSAPSSDLPLWRYEPKAPTLERPRPDGVGHPTTKPLDLMRWLVRLVTPPNGVVLDPFLGSGTTAEACIVEGFRCIGIEREDTYLPMIRARLTKPIQPVLDLGGPT